MDGETVRSLLLLVCGGVLTVLGAWLRDSRVENLRKAHKLEEAYLTWSNMHHGVLVRLQALSRAAERDPESPESMRQTLEAFSEAEAELLKLHEAANAAFFFEKKRAKKELLQHHSEILALLAAQLGEILGHHRLHLQHEDTIREADGMVTRYNELLSAYEVIESTEQYREEIAVDLEAAVRLRDTAREHLTTCVRQLHTDAKSLSEEVKNVAHSAKHVREAISR